MSSQQGRIQANAEDHYEVTREQLPLSCPTSEMTLWNSHPRVYLPIETTGSATCPYCGATFVLADAKQS
ncbi:MAG: zinc-finger domain-containing protein [Gammaproteobacteria bacterium]|jgi:uncharacterized Zn-finger protein|nr:MAG: zinc-finger domain-containing protein [Gammaproteobacteria bacterium]